MVCNDQGASRVELVFGFSYRTTCFLSTGGCGQVSQRVSVAEIRRIGQPESITGRRTAEHWSASLYLRHWSPYLTWLLLPTGISANGVTFLMMLVGKLEVMD